MGQAPDVVTFGETMTLMRSSETAPLRHVRQFQLGVGGAESNTAIGLARLGHHASWMGRVGDDEFGKLVLSTLRGEDVDVSRASVDSIAPTGLMIRNQRIKSHVQVVYYRSGSAGSRISSDTLDEDLVRSARFLYITGITPALSDSARSATFAAVEVARSAGTDVVLDPNYRSKLWSAREASRCLMDLAARADIVLTGLDEGQMLTDGANEWEVLEELRSLGCSEVVVRRGQDGPIAGTPDGYFTASAPFTVVQDPVGSGDAFNAGYLNGLLTGEPPQARLEAAANISALVLQTDGDWEGLPLLRRLDNPHIDEVDR